MSLFQALEAEYTALRAFSREDGELGSRLTSLGYVSLQAFAIVAPLAVDLALPNIVAAFFGICSCLYLLLDRRRVQLAAMYWRTDWAPSWPQRLAIVAFMTVSSIAIVIVARYSIVAAAFAYLMTAALPLQRWINGIGTSDR